MIFIVLRLRSLDRRAMEEEKLLEHSVLEELQTAEPNPGDTYRKLLRVDLLQDRCVVVKSDLEGWQPGEGSLLGQLEDFARQAIFPADRERFLSFVRPEHLCSALPEGQRAFTLLYRRTAGLSFRWNLMEFIPEPGGRGGILCVKDVHDVLEECLEREGLARLRQDEEQRQEAARHQALEDRTYIISSLSTLFFSTYYVDLEQDTFRAVTQLRSVGDLLGDEVHLAPALQIYANHFIHPDDRAEYLRVMDAENLRQSLRWWQPYVAVEYRKLPGDPSSAPNKWVWVRATAVLARTGTDDMPKTAVYVAQELTGPHHRPDED